MYVSSSFSISFFHKPTLIRLFSCFSVEMALDKVISNIRVPKFKVSSQFSLCLTCKQHLTWSITHFSFGILFSLLASRIPHIFVSPMPPLPSILLVSSYQFPLLFLPFSSLKLVFPVGVVYILNTSFDTISTLAPKLVSLRSLFL